VSVVVIQGAATGYSVVVPHQETGTTTTTAPSKDAPNPILPVGSEMAWGLGSFLVLVLLMRVWLFPKLKKGTDARYAMTQGNLEEAERVRAAGAEDVARYEAAMAEINAEAARRLELARQEVDADRTTKVNAANARIAERRATASAEIEAARREALAGTQPIVLEIGASAAERILGVPVDRAAAQPIVAEIVEAGSVHQ
jgi:F-type H+-transporting ATPase subunit b